MKAQTQNLDREAWLTTTAHRILTDIIAPECEIPKRPFRIALGFPSGRTNKVLAQCWPYQASADGTTEIFVSPVADDSVEILGSLAHELIHYTDNCESGHRKHFAKVARAIGLEGKLTATTVGDELRLKLRELIDEYGPIPHARLNAEKGRKKQSTRMLKVECMDCGLVFRAAYKHVAAIDFQDGHCPACDTVGSLHSDFQ